MDGLDVTLKASHKLDIIEGDEKIVADVLIANVENGLRIAVACGPRGIERPNHGDGFRMGEGVDLQVKLGHE